MKALFTPISYVNKKVVSYLLIGQVISFLIIWIFSPFTFLPTPAETISAGVSLWDSGIMTDLLTSLYLNVEAVIISIILSLGLSYLFTIPFFRPTIMGLSKLRFLSLVGLTFFFTLYTHNEHQLKTSLLVFSISTFFLTSMVDVIVSIPKEKYDLGRTLKMGNWELLKEIVILGQIDKAFDCLRQNAAIGWMMISMIEGMARTEGGLGAVLIDQNRHFHLSSVMAIQLTILVLGLGQDALIGYLKNVICPYAKLSLEHR